MLHKYLRLLIFTPLTFASASSFDSEARETFTFLQQSIEQQHYDKAWQLAQNLSEDNLGNADFDFLYGIAALANNENEIAVFAFERVVTNKPNWADAWYFLAKAYLYSSNYLAAIDTSNKLLELPISTKINKQTQQLRQIAQTNLDKQSFYINQQLNFNLGHDSNINAGTREDNIFLPFLGEDILLSDNSKETSDQYAAISYQIAGANMFNRKSKIAFSGQANIHQFLNETDYNRMSINASAMYQFDFNGFTAGLGVESTPLWFDNEFYRIQNGVNAMLSKKISADWLFSTKLYKGKTLNKVNKLLNTDDQSINLSMQYRQNNWLHAFSIQQLDEKSEFSVSKHNSRKINTLSYHAVWSIDPSWLTSVNISYQEQKYQADHPFFLETRQDESIHFGAMLLYSPSEQWEYKLSTNFQDKESNFALFSYKRADINLSARLSF